MGFGRSGTSSSRSGGLRSTRNSSSTRSSSTSRFGKKKDNDDKDNDKDNDKDDKDDKKTSRFGRGSSSSTRTTSRRSSSSSSSSTSRFGKKKDEDKDDKEEGEGEDGKKTGRWGSRRGSTSSSSTNKGITNSNVQMTTKYEDLPQDWKDEIRDFDYKLTTFRSTMADIEKEENSPESVPTLLNDVSADTEAKLKKLKSIENSIKMEKTVINSLHKEVTQELRNADLVNREIEYMQSTSSIQNTYLSSNHLPTPYFWELLEKFEKRLEEYSKTIMELSELLEPMDHKAFTPQMLEHIVHSQHEYFVSVASLVGTIHEEVDTQKRVYKKQFKPKIDPFEEESERQKTIDEFRKKQKEMLQQERYLQNLVFPDGTPAEQEEREERERGGSSSSRWGSRRGSTSGSSGSSRWGSRRGSSSGSSGGSRFGRSKADQDKDGDGDDDSSSSSGSRFGNRRKERVKGGERKGGGVG